MSIIIDNL